MSLRRALFASPRPSLTTSSRLVQRRTFSSTADVVVKEQHHDAAHDPRTWLYYSIGGITIVVLFHVYLARMSHDSAPRHEYPYMSINKKQYPWGDGKTPLFKPVASGEHH
ncbi:hypothetical protein QOT17_018048 [Balamuthia mandrillaris]